MTNVFEKKIIHCTREEIETIRSLPELDGYELVQSIIMPTKDDERYEVVFIKRNGFTFTRC